jgi:hypothetical protein
LYNSTDLDLAAILKESTDQLIEALDIPEILVSATLENNNLLDTLAVEDLIEIRSEQSTEQPTEQPTEQSTGRLLILSPTSSKRSLSENTSRTLQETSENYQMSETMSENRPISENLPLAPGNTANHRNKISGSLDS